MGSKKHKDSSREDDKEHKKKRKHRSRSREKKQHHHDLSVDHVLSREEDEESDQRAYDRKRSRHDKSLKRKQEKRYEYGRRDPDRHEGDQSADGHFIRDYKHGMDERNVDERNSLESKDKDDFSKDVANGDTSISLEETNKLREKLGMPLLSANKKPVPQEGDVEQPGAQQGIHRPAGNLQEQKKTGALRERVVTMKEKRLHEKKLRKIKTLGESDSDNETAVDWVVKSRRLEKEKKLAAERAKVLEEMDEEFGVDQLVKEEFNAKDNANAYTSSNLDGLVVRHSLERFAEGKTTILTLQDKKILDEDPEDTLINVNIVDDEKYAKNVEIKKGKPAYNPYATEEVDEFGMVKSHGVLDKYNEEIDGEKKAYFSLGARGVYNASHERRLKEMVQEQEGEQQTLQLPPPKIASDYLLPEEVSFKKVKKKIRKIRKKEKPLTANDLLPLAGQDSGTDLGSRKAKSLTDDSSTDIPGLDLVPSESDGEDAGTNDDLSQIKIDEGDSMDLLNSLHRRKRLKHQGVVTNKVPVAERIKEKLRKGSDVDVKINNFISLNSTSEFCRALGDMPTYGQSGNRDSESDGELEDDTYMQGTKQQTEEVPSASHGWTSVEIDPIPADLEDDEKGGIDEEPIINQGLASALLLAKNKGYLTEDGTRKGAKVSGRFAHLHATNFLVEDKKMDDLDEKYRKRDRYAGSGMTTDFQDLTGYKPTIKLEYVDDNGRVMNAKEAFRSLSHRFHGKGSGKRKLEKRLKKHEEEQLMKTMSSTDTPLGTLNLLKKKQTSEQTPYIVLSGGKSGANKGIHL